jgi:hypothetical protein
VLSSSPVVLRRAKASAFFAQLSSLVADYASSSARCSSRRPLGQPLSAFGLQEGLRDPSVAAETAALGGRCGCLDLSYGGPALWPTDPATPAGDKAVRPTDKAPSC